MLYFAILALPSCTLFVVLFTDISVMAANDVLGELLNRSTNDVHQSGSPKKLIGVLFLIEFCTFIVFLVCLALRCQEQFVPQKSLVTQSVIGETVSFDPSAVRTLDAVRAYIDRFPLPVLSSSDHDEKTSLVLQTHRLLGALVLSQSRSFMEVCTRWGSDFDCVSSGSRSLGQPFEGVLAGMDIELVFPEKSCPSIMCNPGSRSALSWTFYEAGGPTLYAFGGKIFSSLNSSSIPSNATKLIPSSFIDRFTRYLSVSGTLLDGEGKLVTSFALNFELPIVGGAFAWIETHTVPVNQSDRSQQYAGVVWFYCAAFLVFSVWRSIMGVVNRQRCDVCLAVDGFLAAKCSRCRKPICLDTKEVTRCSWCGVSLQAPQHGCWKAQLDFTRLIPLCNIVTIVVSSVFERQAQNNLQDRMSVFLASPQGHLPVLDVSGPVDQLTRVATLNAFNILIAFVSMYRFLGRAPWIARFLRVFSSGGFLMAFFFVGFGAVFFGFMLSFHLLLGETTSTFATISGAFAGTFQLLLGLLDWESVSTYLFSSSFTALYLFFCWVCVLVMVNVLISLVTAEYKRSRKVQAFDIETESCKMLFSRTSAADPSSFAGSNNSPEENDRRVEESRKVVEDMNLSESRVLPLINSAKGNIGHMETSLDVMEADSKSVHRSAAALQQLSAALQSIQ